MKFLLLLLYIPSALIAGGRSEFTKTILGHTYRFVTDTEDVSVVYLRILNENDSVLLERYALLNGGDCNFHSNEASAFELQGDHLFLYTYRHDSDSYGYFPGINSYLAIKEEFVFQKSGRLVRTGFVSGGINSEVWKEVTGKISRQIDLAESNE